MVRQGNRRFNEYRPSQFQENMFFIEVLDNWIYEMTNGRFPENFNQNTKSTHPIIVRSRAFIDATVCPNTAQCQNDKSRSPYYIPKNTALSAPLGFIIDKDSYMLDIFRFKIPHSFSTILNYKGIVPKDKIIAR